MNLLPCLLLLSLFWALPAARAEDVRGAEVQLVAFKVVTEATVQGAAKESLEPLQALRPGDTVEYEATYVNGSGKTLTDVQLAVPIPAGGLVLIAAQKPPFATSASADGSRFAALPLTRTDTAPDGRRITRPIPLSEYRALRWDLGDVPAGATRKVRARMQLPATARLDG